MTISTAARRPDSRSVLPDLRCDLCGRRTDDPAAHLAVCLEYELAMFAVGRRAG